MAKNFPKDVFKDFSKPERLENIFYEIKSSVKIEDLRILKSAGMNICQPGIETLDDGLLKILNKGTFTADNIRFLRDCKTLGITPIWNFLFDIPGEKEFHYADMINDIIPFISHLQPPYRIIPMMIHRFSPVYEHPDSYGVRNLKPMDEYFNFLPDDADVTDLAYYFYGEYDTALENGELKEKFFEATGNWFKEWEGMNKPVLQLYTEDGRNYISDTRSDSAGEYVEIDMRKSELLKKMHNPFPEKSVVMDQDFIYLLERKYILKTGKFYISLVCG